MIGLVSAVGYAADVGHCRDLCALTRRVVQRGDTADMLARSFELQCGAALREARAAAREDFAAAGAGTAPIFGTTSLIRAAMRDDLPRALLLVRLGAALGAADASGRRFSALHWCAELGHERVARALLDGRFEGRGAGAEQRTAFGATALVLASARGHEAVVRLLLARGARCEARNELGNTALHSAVAGNHAGVVALLLRVEGSRDALALRDRYGRTPIDRAIGDGHAAIAAALRSAQAAAGSA